MFATGEIVSLAEWIIDDTYLLLLVMIVLKPSELIGYMFLQTVQW